MDPSWLQTAGKLSLYFYFIVVGALLIAIVARAGRLTRFFFEYVANVSIDEHASRRSVFGDRRRIQHVRVLVDQIKKEMDRRDVPSKDREEFMRELRETIRSEERFLEVKNRDIQAEEQFLEAQRRGLAERFDLLLVDSPPEIVARIKAGFINPADSPGIAGDKE